MGEVLHLESDVIHLAAGAANEVYRVVVGVAAHEDEIVVDPVRNLESKNAGVEFGHFIRVFHVPRDMAELERADAVMRQVLAEIIPFLEQRDRGSLVVLETEQRTDAGRGIVAQLARDAVLAQFLRHGSEIGIRRDFERQPGAAFALGLVDRDGEQADLGDEEGPLLFALDENKTQHFRVVVDHLFQVGCLEGGVSDAPRLDHVFLRPCFQGSVESTIMPA